MMRGLRILVVFAVVTVLAACSTEPAFTDLDREATSVDVLPSDLPAYASEDFVADSVRFAGEHDGVQYYLARSTELHGACVVAFESAEEWVGGCGSAGVLTIGGAGRSTIVAPDGSPELDEGTPVGANIVVR